MDSLPRALHQLRPPQATEAGCPNAQAGKADLLGLLAMEAFAQRGDLPWEKYQAILRMYLGADISFVIYRNPNEAHAKLPNRTYYRTPANP